MSEKENWTGEDLKTQDSQSKVKEQIMCIVKDLELVLGELKTVSTEMKEVFHRAAIIAKSSQHLETYLTQRCSAFPPESSEPGCLNVLSTAPLRELHQIVVELGEDEAHPLFTARAASVVVGQIDQLTANLNICEDTSRSYKSDTLDSSSSGVTMSSLEKSKDRPKVILRTAPTSTTVLTVLRKSKPPPPPPRRTPVRAMSPAKIPCIDNKHKINGTLVQNGTHSPTDQLEDGGARCSPSADTPMWGQKNQMEDAGHTKPVSDIIPSGQRPSQCSLCPCFNTRHEHAVQQQDVYTANVHCCCPRSGRHPCLHGRTPVLCNSSTSTTNVHAKPHPKNPRKTVRKPMSTTV